MAYKGEGSTADCVHVNAEAELHVGGDVNFNIDNSMNFNATGTFSGAFDGMNFVTVPYCVNDGDIYTGKSIVKKVLTGRENYISLENC